MQENKIELLEASFAEVFSATDAAAALFYERLFSNDPSLRTLFDTSSMTRQGRKLMASLALVVRSLRNLETIVPVLEALAIRHVDYGVRDEHYATVGKSLIETLSLFFGTRFDAELRAAWVEAYEIVSSTMIAATPRMDMNDCKAPVPHAAHA